MSETPCPCPPSRPLRLSTASWIALSLLVLGCSDTPVSTDVPCDSCAPGQACNDEGLCVPQCPSDDCTGCSSSVECQGGLCVDGLCTPCLPGVDDESCREAYATPTFYCRSDSTCGVTDCDGLEACIEDNLLCLDGACRSCTSPQQCLEQGYPDGVSCEAGRCKLPGCDAPTPPSELVAEPTELCVGEASTLSLMGGTLGQDASWHWYQNECASKLDQVGTGPTTTVYPTKTTSYFVRAVGFCGASACAQATVTVLSSVAGLLSASKEQVCTGEGVSLWVDAHVGNVQWESSPDATNWSELVGETSATLTLPSLTTPSHFRAKVSNAGCAPEYTAAQFIGLLPPPKPAEIHASNIMLCAGSSATLSAQGHEGSLQWQSSSNGADWQDLPGANANTYQSSALTQNTFFRVRISREGCESLHSEPLLIEVSASSQGGVASASPEKPCQGQSTSLSLSGHIGTVQWQSSIDGANWTDISGATASTYLSQNLQQSTWYRASVRSEQCGDAFSSQVRVETSSLPVAGSVLGSPNPICVGASVELTASGYSGALQWQSSVDNTQWTDLVGATSATYTTPGLSSSTYYRVKVLSGSCEPALSSSLQVQLSPLSVGGTVSASPSTVCAGGTTSLTLSGHTGSIQWQSSPNNSTWSDIAGATSATLSPTGIAATTYYRVRVTSGACPSALSTVGTVNTTALPVAGTVTTTTPSVCSGGSASLTLAGSSGSIQWQQSSDNASWTDISGATAGTYQVSNLDANRYFRAKVSRAPCDAVYALPLLLTLKTASTQANSASASPNSICQGSNATLGLSGGSLGTGAVWKWYSGSCGGTLVGTGTTSTVAPTVTTSYFVRAEGDCNTTACVSTAVNVAAPSVGGTAAATCCSRSGSLEIQLSLTGFTGTLQWQVSTNNATWTDIAGATTASYAHTASSSFANYYFRARVKHSVCAEVLSSVAEVRTYFCGTCGLD